MKANGYTMVEVMISTSILGVVSLLGFVVLKSSNEAAQLTTAKVDVQNNLRDTMSAMTGALREGVSQRTTELTGAPESLYAVAVDADGHTITFQTPEPADNENLFTYSTPITFSLEFEDDNENGRLDEGEDDNGDGILNRRIIRTQDGVDTIVASSNTIDSVVFTMIANQAATNNTLTTVNIKMLGSKRYGPGEGKLVASEMEANIRLVN